MSGTPSPATGSEGVTLPRRLSDAANVLVLDAPRGASEPGPWTDAAGVGPRTDGPFVFVAFTRADAALLDEWPPNSNRAVYVLDATPQSTIAARAESEPGLTVEPVSSPSNLTDVGVALDKLCSALEPSDGRPVCWLPSLTALLQHVDRQRAYQFLNAVGNRLASVDAFAHYHLDEGARDDQTVDTFASLMDAVVLPTDDGVRIRRR